MGLTTNAVRGRNAERLLVLIHGLGSDERDLAGLLPYLDPDGRFVTVLPRGPYAQPPGYAWFKFGGPEALTSGTIQSSIDAVEDVIDDSCHQFGMKATQAVVGGFSQGAMLAYAMVYGTDADTKPAGVLAMSGSLPPGMTLHAGPPALVQHGTHDPMIPVSRGRQAAEALSEIGVPVVYREYPMEHQVALESVRDAKAWLDQIRAGEKPADPEGAAPAAAAPEQDGVKHVTSAQFEAEVLRNPLPVIVDFWAPWCGPCKQVDPVIRQMAAMRKGRYAFVKVNIDECPDLQQAFQIQSIPLVALFRGGKLERRSLGAKPRQQLEADLGMLVIP